MPRSFHSVAFIFTLTVAVLLGLLSPADAAISFVASAQSSSGYNSVTVFPVAMPASVPAGDLCIAQLMITGYNFPTRPSGWNTIREDINSYDGTLGLYWHITGSSEPAGYSWAITATNFAFYEAVISCYSGVNTVAPIDPGAPSGSGAIVHGTSLTVPSITTQNTGDLIIGSFMDAENNYRQGTTITPPASLINRSSFTDASADYLVATFGDRTQSTKGATGTLSITTTNGDPGDALIGQQVALVPSSSSPPPPPPPPPPSGSISFDASANTSSGYTATTSLEVNMPVVAAGDICIAQMDITGAFLIDVPAGWTKIREDLNGWNGTLGLYWHLTGSEPASYTWLSSGQVYYEAGISCYRGVDHTTPIDPGAPKGAAATALGTSLTVPSITTKTSGDVIIGSFMDAQSNWGQNVSINAPVSLTPRWNLTDASANYLSATFGDKTQSSAGATGTLSVTTNHGLSGDAIIGQQLALQPGS